MTPPRARAALAAATLGTVAALGVGCAPRVHPALEDARAAWVALAAEPDVGTRAPVALHAAERALEDAERDWADRHDPWEAEHDAYLVRRRVEIARTIADRARKGAAADAGPAARRDDGGTRRALAALRPRETARGLELTLVDAFFEPGRAALVPAAAAPLAALVALLQAEPDRHVAVEGHADDAAAHVLSDRRANAVRDHLVAHGIAPGRVVATGFGEAYPVASNATEAGRRRNRRVDVVILERGAPPAEVPDDRLAR